jgi:hypothetical protein
LFCLAFGLIALLPAFALAGDGDIAWRTLKTPRWQIHYPAHYHAFAQRTAAVLDDALRTLQPLFAYEPQWPLHVSIDDFSDSANGFATPLPYDRIHLQAYPPDVTEELADHGDWLRMLVFHELTHVLHLGQVGGLPQAVNAVLGRTLLPGGTVPRFVTEGLATHVETRHTGGDTSVAGHGGRVGSAQFTALIRAAVLDGTLPTDASAFAGRPLVWPRGTMWYLYGSLLVDQLVQQHGLRPLQDFITRYSTSLIGYGLQNTARAAWGASLSRLWQDARRQTIADVKAQWQAEQGATAALAQTTADGQPLTRDGEWRGRLRRAGPDRVVVAHGPRDGLPRIELLQVPDGKRLQQHICQLDCDEPIALPEGGLLFVAHRPMRRVYRFRELVWLPQPGANEVVLTRGMRVRSIALSDDGKWLTAVRIRGGQTEVVALPWPALLVRSQGGTVPEQAGAVPDGPATDDPLVQRWLSPLPIGQTWDTPVVLSGQLFVTRQVGGERQLWHGPVAESGKEIKLQRAVGAHVAARDPLLPLPQQGTGAHVVWVGDLQPTGDGRLSGLISLAGTGMPRRDAAVWDPAAPQRGWQLQTRTLTGLASAAVLASGTATVRHGGRGLDVWWRPQSGAAATVPPAAAADLPGSATPTTAEPTYLPPPPVAATRGRYVPWSLRPRAWRPVWVATAGESPTVGATLWGRDALEWAELSLLGQGRLDGTAPVLTAELMVSRFEPTLSLSAAYDQSPAWFVRGFTGYETLTERLGLRGAIGWNYPLLRSSWSAGLALRGVRTGLVNPWDRRELPVDPAGVPPRDPWTGWQGLVDFTLGWGYGQNWPDQTRSERLHSANLQVTLGDRQTGGEQVVIGQLQTRHHLALGQRRFVEVAGNLAAAPEPGGWRGLYRVSGVSALDPLTILGLAGPQGWVVRGLRADGLLQNATYLGGDGLAWGTAALHWPLPDIGRTLDLLPVYLGRPYLSLLSDWAWAFWPAPGLRGGGMASVGLELAIDIEAGYLPLGLLRLGYARTLDGGGAGWLTIGP